MPAISNAQLSISPVSDNPGRRQVEVIYDVRFEADDGLVGAMVTETVLIHGVDTNDAPVAPSEAPLVHHVETFTATQGSTSRLVRATVRRSDLDVERDWWSTGHGGETKPIAEWVDHLVAEIEIVHQEVTVARAKTPVVSGSWGALGDD